MNEDELYNELKNWFDITPNKLKQNFWQNRIAGLIRERLDKMGNFKNAPRGNSNKGFKKMQESIAKRSGWSGPNIEE